MRLFATFLLVIGIAASVAAPSALARPYASWSQPFPHCCGGYYVQCKTIYGKILFLKIHLTLRQARALTGDACA